MMHTQQISFPKQEVPCAFPDTRESLAFAISKLKLEESYPVIILIGGDIQEAQAQATREALESLAEIAENTHALLISTGKGLGVTAEIGLIRHEQAFTFPLIGISPEALVTWPNGPGSNSLLWLGNNRQPLAQHYTHFILVPGSHDGDETSWILAAAGLLSKNNRSVTIVVSGEADSQKEVQMSIEQDRPVIVVSGTGRFANELANQATRNTLISVVPATAEERLSEAIRVIFGSTRSIGKPASAPLEIELIHDDGDLAPTSHSPTMLSQRDEFKPIHAEKSQSAMPDSFLK
jgi:hypothetical protein